jgi:predicted CXXCH cytochrome family protein
MEAIFLYFKRRTKMRKLTVLLVMSLAFGLAAFGVSIAVDKGPADMILESTIDPAKKPKPSIFPHAAHQSRLECGDCHHGKDDAGKMVPYVEGQEIGKCESCHNKAAGMPKKIETYKGAAHEMCKGCHAQTDKKLAKCSVCHPKDLTK